MVRTFLGLTELKSVYEPTVPEPRCLNGYTEAIWFEGTLLILVMSGGSWSLLRTIRSTASTTRASTFCSTRGLRISELVCVAADEIDFNTGAIHVNK